MQVEKDKRSTTEQEIERSRRILRVESSLVITLVILAVAWHHVSNFLSGKSDVIGYPLFVDFNVNRYFDGYYLSVIVGPLLFILSYQLLSRFGPIRRNAPKRHVNRDTPTPVGDEHLDTLKPKISFLSHLARLLGVGSLLGLEIQAAFGFGSLKPPWTLLISACVFAAAVAGVSTICSMAFHSTRWTTTSSIIDIIGVLAMVPLLYKISTATTVTVLSTGKVVHYPWMPLWAAIVMTALLVAYVAHRRVRNKRGFEVIERNLILFLALPIGIFIVHASIPGALGPLDPFGDGEYLAGGWLMLHGAMPWRDLYLIHGVFDDGFKSIIGFEIFGPSRWGADAGIAMIVNPIYWVCTYYFGALLFNRRTFFVLGVAASVTLGVFIDQDPRYTFWPLVLVLLARVLERRSPSRVLMLAAGLIAQAILIPEMAYAVVACGAAIILFEFYERRSKRLAFADFPMTLYSLAFAVILCGGFLVWLVVEHATSGFIGYYEDFANAHSLVGGIPLYTNYAVGTPTSALGITLHAVSSPPFFTRYRLELILPVLAIIATIGLFVVRIRAGKRLVVFDWLCFAGAAMVALYYQKGISRGDSSHISEVFCVTVPLLILLAYRFVAGVELAFNRHHVARRLNRFFSRTLSRLGVREIATPISFALLLFIIAIAPSSVNSLVANTSSQYRSSSPTPAPAPFVKGGPSVGYNVDGISTAAVIDINTIFDSYAGKTGPVFDFSNSPAVVSFFLNRKLTSQFYNINDVIAPSTEEELIGQLEASKPKVILFNGIGMGTWDFIPNEIRDSTVSDYILSNYHPLVLADGQLLLLKDGIKDSKKLPKLEGPVQTTRLYSSLGTCNWGYIPDFLETPATPSIPPTQPSHNVGFHLVAQTKNGTIYELDRQPDLQSFHWISVTITGATGSVGLAVSSFPRKSQRDITWVAKGSGTTEVEVASCLQWHGFGDVLFLRYLGSGTPTNVTMVS